VRAQEKSSPARSSDTNVEQQLHYKQVLELQRQLLERVGGRSTPASSQKSSASTEKKSPERLDAYVRKAPTAKSLKPAIFADADAASGADAAFVFDGSPTEHATLSLRRPSVHMTPCEARLSNRLSNLMTHADHEENVHDFEGTLGEWAACFRSRARKYPFCSPLASVNVFQWEEIRLNTMSLRTSMAS
jgi:hypothetical protein